MTPYFGRPKPTRIHLRPQEARRRTVCGRDLPKVSSVPVQDLFRRHLVSCRQCLARLGAD